MITLIPFFFYLLAIFPVYYSEEGCDLYRDLETFDELLQQDIVVKTFVEKYHNVTPTVEGIDESDPPKADIRYKYDDEKTQIELWVYVREYSEEPNDCFWPVRYTLAYQDGKNTTNITNYSWDRQEILDFLSGAVINSPYEQLKQGIAPENVRCHDKLELIFKSSDGSPACVKSETAQKLIERGWAKPI